MGVTSHYTHTFLFQGNKDVGNVSVLEQQGNNHFLRPKLDASCWRKTIGIGTAKLGHQTTMSAACFLLSWTFLNSDSVQLHRLELSGLQLMVFQQRLLFRISGQLGLRHFFETPILLFQQLERSWKWFLCLIIFRKSQHRSKEIGVHLVDLPLPMGTWQWQITSCVFPSRQMPVPCQANFEKHVRTFRALHYWWAACRASLQKHVSVILGVWSVD